MKVRTHFGSSRKPETKAHWTTNVARYTMLRENHTHGTSEDLREAIAQSSGLSSQESRA